MDLDLSNIAISSFLDGFMQSALIIFIFMTMFFVFSVIVRRNDIADIIWGLGFVFLTWINIYSFGSIYDPITTSLNLQVLLIGIIVTLWGFRLSIHIFLRNYKKEEDFRYKKWRNDWGKWFFVRSYFQVFILQGVLMLLILTPIISIVSFGYSSMSFVTILGFLIWIDGFIFESLGDYQLKKFLQNPLNKGKIMTGGLWKYTRHPNYYGEVSQWWGIYLMCLPLIWPLSLISIIGPLTITFLILKVSGIPMLEKRYEGNLEFEMYKKRTNTFFPWFPNK
jgi:steroid 5-alpha reductase family enzyme